MPVMPLLHAEAVGGTVDSFVKLMNDYAAGLNMTNTVFVNPTGSYDENSELRHLI